MTPEQAAIARTKRAFFSDPEAQAYHAGRALRYAIDRDARSAAHRLVKGAQSPTKEDGRPWKPRFVQVTPAPDWQPGSDFAPKAREELDRRAPVWHDVVPATGEIVRAVNPALPVTERKTGRFAVLSYRHWSREYRLRTLVTAQGVQPPGSDGQRQGRMLTQAGARKIGESCEYVARARGGYTTFLTLTLDEDARRRVREGETTIQREVSRFFDAAQKLYQRGYVLPYRKRRLRDGQSPAAGWIEQRDENGTRWEVKRERVTMPPARSVLWRASKSKSRTDEGWPVTWLAERPEPLDYVWVIENPDRIETTDDGAKYVPLVQTAAGRLVRDTNPHVHVLMRWQVPYEMFSAWAERLESLWGQGFAHLERIKDPESAGAYMAKAAGYIAKASGQDDQGEVRGNRYGIAERARAPGWTEAQRWSMGTMGTLIAIAHEYNRPRRERVRCRKAHLKARLALLEGKSARAVAQREAIKNELLRVREAERAAPRVSPYQIIFRCREQVRAWMTFAETCRRPSVNGPESVNGRATWLPSAVPDRYAYVKEARGLTCWQAMARHGFAWIE